MTTHNGPLTDVEQAALNNPAIVEQARVINALNTLYSLGDTAFEAVRIASKPDAKKIRKHLTVATRLIEEVAAHLQTPETGVEPSIVEEHEIATSPDYVVSVTRKLLGDDFDLTGHDAASLARIIHEKAGAPTARLKDRTPIDPVHRIEMRLQGKDYKTIAEKEGSTGASVSQWFTTKIHRALKAESADTDASSEILTPEISTPDKIIERPISDSPEHIRITDKFATLLSFDSADIASFTGLIDPKNTGQITNNKLRVIKKIRDAIDQELGGLVVLTSQLEAKEAARLGRLLGFKVEKGRLIDQPPFQLTQQFRSLSDISERRAIERFLYDALNKIADLLQEKLQIFDEESVPPQSIKQIVFVDGNPQLSMLGR